MSLWPTPFTLEQKQEYKQASSIERKKLSYLMERAPSFHQTLEQDINDENDVNPQVVVCLYSLDTDMIENEFEKIKNNTTGWRLIGSNLLLQKVESMAETLIANSKVIESQVGRRTVDNCASLAAKLLYAGGTSKLVDDATYSTFSTKTSSVVKPDEILKIIIPAKLAELKKFPETQHLALVEETPMNILQPPSARPSWCNIS